MDQSHARPPSSFEEASADPEEARRSEPEEVARLAKLSKLGYDRQRNETAAGLGVRGGRVVSGRPSAGTMGVIDERWPRQIIGRPIPRRGLSRVEAAIYLGVSPSKFDAMRKDGRVGPAKLIDGRKVFDVRMLDEIFDALPEENLEEVEDWTVAI